MTAAALAEHAVGFLTENELSPSTRDLLTLAGISEDSWFEEDEKISVIRDIVGAHLFPVASRHYVLGRIQEPEFRSLAGDWTKRTGETFSFAASTDGKGGGHVMFRSAWSRVGRSMQWHETFDAAEQAAQKLHAELTQAKAV
jgi:hypothetical protein